ncbi:MAG: hypothetical protein JSS27_20985 [Planctomycetes bacterium]|nr:hypothetical protein [Planctomycetota bacterium]
MRSSFLVTDVRNVLGSTLVRNVVAGCREVRSDKCASKSFGKRFAFLADHLGTALRHLWRTTRHEGARYQAAWSMQPAGVPMAAMLPAATATATGWRINAASRTPAAATSRQ